MIETKKKKEERGQTERRGRCRRLCIRCTDHSTYSCTFLFIMEDIDLDNMQMININDFQSVDHLPSAR